MTQEPRTPLLHVTVAAIVERENRFLLVEEMVGEKQVLNQPAGHVEHGESFTGAVIRETLEETAWDFHPVAVTGIYRWRMPQTGETFLRHCFSGSVQEHHAERSLDTDILRTVWLSLDELKRREAQLRSPLVLRCIEDYLAGQRYPLSLYHDID